MTAKKVLGKGLDALFSERIEVEEAAEKIPSISIDDIIPNRFQPRKIIDEDRIDELASSIKENGLIQPIVVRKMDGKYEIIVGERRVRAAKKAGLKEIPALIKEYSDIRALEIALIENLQREDLNPIEEALAYKMIIEREMITQEELSKKIGKSRSYIANMMRLLELPESVKEHVSRGTISVGQAKAILAVSDHKSQEELVKKILAEQLSVREVEKIARRKNVPRETKEYRKDPHLDEIEDQLRTRFGTKVVVEYRSGRGTIKVEFYSREEFERILDQMLSR
ncbi:MAG: ParB/RepB/Spo0J family partition protein [Candidatus Jordarchaeum sp.]|uniref:ParB/RepB/Spo0J family partition protein n=1 Tax=Candidatus Jordarchaeum sp. TaxID=2823881 RepID=UPI00404B3308